MRKPIWNDQAFKRWVREGAKARGKPLHEVLKAAGVNRFYLNEKGDSRSVNIVLNLADVLEISPAPLFSLPSNTGGGKTSWRLWETKLIDRDIPRTERTTLMARVIAVQMAAMIHVASDETDSDPTTLMELVLREINKPHNRSASKRSEAEGAS